MPTILVTAELTSVSGLAEDSAMNRFVVQHLTAAPAQGSTLDWVGPINTFFNDIGSWLSPKVARTAGGIKYKLYDISDALAGQPHGSPVATDTGTLLTAAGATTSLPAEVAMVLTTRAEGWDGAPVESPDDTDLDTRPERPRSRLTGRHYLGPLGTWALDGAEGRPAFQFRDGARTAYQAMVTSFAATGRTLRVWSKETGIAPRVVAVQTDDAFDTQRRRGVAPTARVTLTLT